MSWDTFLAAELDRHCENEFDCPFEAECENYTRCDDIMECEKYRACLEARSER